MSGEAHSIRSTSRRPACPTRPRSTATIPLPARRLQLRPADGAQDADSRRAGCLWGSPFVWLEILQHGARPRAIPSIIRRSDRQLHVHGNPATQPCRGRRRRAGASLDVLQSNFHLPPTEGEPRDRPQAPSETSPSRWKPISARCRKTSPTTRQPKKRRRGSANMPDAPFAITVDHATNPLARFQQSNAPAAIIPTCRASRPRPGKQHTLGPITSWPIPTRGLQEYTIVINAD